MRITRIQRHPRRERMRLYVDQEPEPRAELAVELVASAGLAVDIELEPAELARLEAEDASYRARDAALGLLSQRPRSRAELRRRLAQRDLPGGVVESTLAWLEERGWVDDGAFAEAFVRDRLRLRPRGRVGLLRELRGRGVDEAVAEAAVARVLDDEAVDEHDLALRTARGWARRNRAVIARAARSRDDRLRARRRLYGHLARRGFSPDAVRAAIAGVLAD